MHQHPIEPPSSSSRSLEKFLSDYIESHRPNAEHATRSEILSDDSAQHAGMVVVLFCTSLIDIAHKFNIPSYIFFTPSAAFLGFMLYLPIHHDQVGCGFGPHKNTQSYRVMLSQFLEVSCRLLHLTMIVTRPSFIMVQSSKNQRIYRKHIL